MGYMVSDTMEHKLPHSSVLLRVYVATTSPPSANGYSGACDGMMLAGCCLYM